MESSGLAWGQKTFKELRFLSAGNHVYWKTEGLCAHVVVFLLGGGEKLVRLFWYFCSNTNLLTFVI